MGDAMKGGPRWLNDHIKDSLVYGSPWVRLSAMGMQSPVGSTRQGVHGMFPNFSWPIMAEVPKTDQEIDDEVKSVIDGWSREQQIIAYKLLYAEGFKIGASLDHELSELRRTRRLRGQST